MEANASIAPEPVTVPNARAQGTEVCPALRYNRTDHVNLLADSWRLARRLVLA